MRRFDAKFRRGLTLIELLVVIGIIGMLAAVTIPVMLPAVEARRTREAARGVSAFLAGARARAIENGRPVGVVLHRMANENAASMTLFYAEQPPPFAGFTTGATATVQYVKSEPLPGMPASSPKMMHYFQTTLNNYDPSLIHKGDQIQFNHQGYLYEITGPEDPTTGQINGTPIQLQITTSASAQFPWPASSWSGPLPYQIFRQPQVSSASPYQLPAGMIVDLSASGVGTDVFPYANSSSLNIAIVFNPDGSVNSIYKPNSGNVLTRYPVPSTIFLLVGKRENVPMPALADQTMENTNFRDLSNLWVTISPRSGQATVAEVAPISTGGTLAQAINNARAFARDQGVLGGQ